MEGLDLRSLAEDNVLRFVDEELLVALVEEVECWKVELQLVISTSWADQASWLGWKRSRLEGRLMQDERIVDVDVVESGGEFILVKLWRCVEVETDESVGEEVGIDWLDGGHDEGLYTCQCFAILV